MSSPSEKMTRFKTKCRPLKVKAKAKAAAFLSAIKIAVKAADYIANVTQVTKLQVVTGVACKIIECCETMRDNKEQAEELANVVRDVVATLDGVANRPHLGDEDEQLKKDAAPLAKALYTIEKSMSKIAGAKKWKKLCNVGSDAKTIKDCSEKLRTALNIFQTKNGVALRAELAHVSAVFGAIGHDVTILPVVHEHGSYPPLRMWKFWLY
ncbi:hypothetical protein OBBRIDRAFT_432861 [Obba rivulosa]|uniref:Uncharacterized protein n=1 Tax=Obba rivulosa TaxID=1052685 RepID=A0A8E2DEW1_9APHY|nr:hypothetical protein OBBRIDRAFT_432861 [Obba rivulosa]